MRRTGPRCVEHFSGRTLSSQQSKMGRTPYGGPRLFGKEDASSGQNTSPRRVQDGRKPLLGLFQQDLFSDSKLVGHFKRFDTISRPKAGKSLSEMTLSIGQTLSTCRSDSFTGPNQPNKKTLGHLQSDTFSSPDALARRTLSILGHNFGADQHFCAKFCTVMENEQSKGTQCSISRFSKI